MPKNKQEAAETTSQAAPVESAPKAEEQAPVSSEPIQIAGLDYEPSVQKFEMVLGDERPEGFVDPVSPKTNPDGTPVPTNYHDSEVLRKEKERERAHGQDLRNRVLATLKQNIQHARNPEPPKAQPVPALIAEQTRLEMEAGRKANEHHAAIQAIPPRRIDPPRGVVEPKTVPVFRPGDVDEYRDTFKSPVQTQDKQRTGSVQV
jgi:cell division septation protein DedD